MNSRSAGEQHRRGFTLIETIIAMSLMSLLMAIVWTMFSVYTKLESKGTAAAAETALVRSIDRQFRSDILQIVGLSPLGPQLIDDRTSAALAKFPTNGYLVGSQTDLHFVVFADSHSLATPGSIRVVSYQPRQTVEETDDDSERMTDLDDTAADDLTLAADAFDDELLDEFTTPQGIDVKHQSWRDYWQARESFASLDEVLSTNRPITLDADDFLQIGTSQLDAEDTAQALHEPAEVTDEVPEIRRVRFRYFDGQTWTAQWDSTLTAALPRAIEFQFDLDMDPVGNRDSGNINAGSVNSDAINADAMNSGTINVAAGDDDDANQPRLQYRIVVAVLAAVVAPGTGDATTDSTLDRFGAAAEDWP
jgi:prepilin-type N-terminal cleavage/methylation domain-containing protein